MDRPHSRVIGVNDFVRWSNEKALRLAPDFQRRQVWPRKARAFLIDTILRGLPVPKIYMRQHLDLRTSKTMYDVVDGKQRITAVLDFVKGDLALAQDSDKFPGKKFSALPQEVRRAFLSYELSVDVLVNAADVEVLDVFARINSHSAPLNPQEKRNARYFGSFKTTVYSLVFGHLEFWKKHKILGDSSIMRMKEAELTSELLVAMISGMQDKKKSLDSYYDRWDDRFPYRQKVVERFHDIINLIEAHLGHRLVDSNFRRPALFYSLFLALYQLRYGRQGNVEGGKRAFAEREGQKLRATITKLDRILDAERPDEDYLPFITASQRQTDNIAPRRTRLATILTEFKATG